MLLGLGLFAHLHDLSFTLEVETFSQKDLQEVPEGLPHVNLDESELFIALVLQDLRKEGNLMIISKVDLDRVYDS